MGKNIRYVGLDVHAATIHVAIAEGRDQPRSLGAIENRPEAIRKLFKKLGDVSTLRVCYEAGPTGYVLYWQLAKLGIHCEVIAPSLIPRKPGERIKTDRRDAIKLARAYRSGDLTPVWVPDAAHEALRDLVRAREAAKKDELRARHRLSKYLLRNGLYPDVRCEPWTQAWWRWLRTVKLAHAAQTATLDDYTSEVEHAGHRVERLDRTIDDVVEQAPDTMRAVISALQALRGIAKITAVTLAVEVGTFARFERPKQLMSYSGMVPSEHSSGGRRRLGAITKTGNARMRRVLVEAAWHYRHRPCLSARQKKLQATFCPKVVEIAWKAQLRLHRRYWRLSERSKPSPQIVTALARELIGFIWAVGVETERAISSYSKAA